MSESSEHLLRMESPVGRIEIRGDDRSVTALEMEHAGRLSHDGEGENPSPVLEEARRQLEEYFAGARHDFDLPLDPAGTEFQRSVWSRLAEVGWGECTSYGALGRDIGRAGSGRAVGRAVGSNPIPIIIGCHRVLASDGRLTGYSGGDGIPTKLWLLEHEGITLAA